MESNASKNIDNNQSSGSQSSTKDSFDMKNCKEALFNDEKEKDSQESKTHSDKEEFFDAEDGSSSEDEEELDVDEEELISRHKDLSDDQLQKLKEKAVDLKNEGNKCFKSGNHKEAILLYTQALNTCPVIYTNERSILYANRAASRIGLEKKDEALLDCNKALDLNPGYLRAVLRRAQLHRKMDNLDRCLEDYKKVLELDKNNVEARKACATLPAEIAERNEKLKEEMFGKLKELGNICLKPFGLSSENFKMVKDPNTGGYSVNFQK